MVNSLRIFLLSLSALAIVGCNNPTSNVLPDSTVCPDEAVFVDRMIFSSSPYDEGEPNEHTTVFGPDTDVIYATFWLTDDLCCTRIFLTCELAGVRVFNWEAEGWDNYGNPSPRAQSVEIKPLSIPFDDGAYTVKVFIDIREVLNTGFVVRH